MKLIILSQMEGGLYFINKTYSNVRCHQKETHTQTQIKVKIFQNMKEASHYGWKEMFFPQLFDVFINRSLGKEYSVEQSALGTLAL